MKVLFICKHNRFRSKVSEALFKHFNKNRKNKVRSAGAHLDMSNLHVAPAVELALKQKGIRIKNKHSRALTRSMIKWADKIIVVADDVSPRQFPKEKTIVWKISDTSQSNLPGIKKRINKIEKKIKNLLKSSS
jgi:protein-tyrosine-phosphatase